MAPARIRRLWLGCTVLTVVLAVLRAVVREGSAAAAVISYAYPLLAIAAILAGIRINRPARRLPWALLIAAMVTGMLGNAVSTACLLRGEPPFPSPADMFWLACYPIELTGLMLLVPGLSWRRDRAGILDTLMVTGGLGLGVWLLVLRDLIGPAVPLDTRLVTMAYPVADLLLTAGAIRMLTSPARRGPAFFQLAASLVVPGLAHAGWVWQSTHGTSHDALIPGFLISALLLGGAALHPSMATLGGGTTRPAAAGITPLRAALIGSACLLSPVLLIADGVRSGDRPGWPAASICCIAVFLLVVARIAGLVRTVQDQAAQLESIACLDSLTGIPNRRAWDAELARRLAVARRSGATLVVGLLDLDHFKRYNDLLGHPAGDELLRTAAGAWQEQMRAEDLLARYGGEEFGVILHCDMRDASTILERLREVTPDGRTFSAGLAQWTGAEPVDQLMARVDAALYTAKREGRDQFPVTGHPARTDPETDFLAGVSSYPR